MSSALKVAVRLSRFVLWGDPYRRLGVLRMAGYAFCGIVMIVALFTAMQPNDHTRYHATSRQSGTR